MREIKFRVWNGHKFLDNNFAITNKGSIIDIENCLWNFEDENCVIQQYTGLKDKNGVEIYEGDIVRGVFFDTDYMGDIVVTCSVNWVADSACFNVGHRYWTRSSLKVIGNIFENPELLES